jgi:hypothetical protein
MDENKAALRVVAWVMAGPNWRGGAIPRPPFRVAQADVKVWVRRF